VHAYLQAYNLHIYGSKLGGSSWSMIFSKRKLLQDIQALARLQYQVV
jgi:CII-binding regulator of phage lambda lysogenization HflD